jgi:hypothetical protein
MRRHIVDKVAPPIYAAIDFIVILTPALAVKVASDRGGMGDAEGMDLVIASAVLGAAHAVLAGTRLRSEERIAVRRADMWIAAFDALVVLALAATVLLAAVFYGFAEEHASLADRGYPVVALWAGIQLIAILAAEATGRLVFWWLEPHDPITGWRPCVSRPSTWTSRRSRRTAAPRADPGPAHAADRGVGASAGSYSGPETGAP